MTTKLPGIPKVPHNLSPELNRFLTALAETVEVRTGYRGDPQDRAVTVRELIETGVIEGFTTVPFNPNALRETSGISAGSGATFGTPPVPTGFTASALYSQILLTWDNPVYTGHSRTEIWRSDDDVFANAVQVGTSIGMTYLDSVGGNVTKYYWVRHVNAGDVFGPFNAISGTSATTAADVTHLLGVLSASITDSELNSALSARIDLIDGNVATSGTIPYQIAAVDAKTTVSSLKTTLANALSSSEFDSATSTAITNAGLAKTATDTLTSDANTTGSVAKQIADEALTRSQAISAVQTQVNNLSGTAAWNSTSASNGDYDTNALVQHSNNIWQSTTDNNNEEPSDTASNWTKLGDYASVGQLAAANQTSIADINNISSGTGSSATAVRSLQTFTGDWTPWAAGQSYTIGQVVSFTDGSLKLFKAKTDHTSADTAGNKPPSTTNWIDCGLATVAAQAAGAKASIDEINNVSTTSTSSVASTLATLNSSFTSNVGTPSYPSWSAAAYPAGHIVKHNYNSGGDKLYRAIVDVIASEEPGADAAKWHDHGTPSLSNLAAASSASINDLSDVSTGANSATATSLTNLQADFSSTVGTFTDWTAGAYALGAVFQHGTPKKIYKSLVGSNNVEPGTDATKWQDLGFAKFTDNVVVSNALIENIENVTTGTSNTATAIRNLQTSTGSHQLHDTNGTYAAGYIVQSGSVLYRSKVDNNTDDPPHANWENLGAASLSSLASASTANIKDINNISSTSGSAAAQAVAALEANTGTYTDWTSGSYSIDTVVKHNGNLWRSIVNSNTATPGADASKWVDLGVANAATQIAASSAKINAIEDVSTTSTSSAASQLATLKAETGVFANYNAATTYQPGAIVKHSNKKWLALQETTGNAPAAGQYWKDLGTPTLSDLQAVNQADILDINNISSTSTSAAAQAIDSLQASVSNIDLDNLWEPGKAYVAGDIVVTDYSNSVTASYSGGWATPTYDPVEDAFKLYANNSDQQLGVAFYAFLPNGAAGYTYEFSLDYKTNQAGVDKQALNVPNSNLGAVYLRAYYSTSAFSAGEWAVGHNNSFATSTNPDLKAGVQAAGASNFQPATTSYVTKSITYSPGASHTVASFNLLNWNDLAPNPVWFKNIRVTVKNSSGNIVDTWTYAQRRFRCIQANTDVTLDDPAYWVDIGAGLTGTNALIDDINDVSATSNSASARSVNTLQTSVTDLSSTVGSFTAWSQSAADNGDFDNGSIVTYNNKVFKSKANNNTETPAAGTYWQDLGAAQVTLNAVEARSAIDDINNIASDSGSASAQAIHGLEANVGTPSYTTWSAIAFNDGDIVKYTGDGKLYRADADTSASDVPGTDAVWVDVGNANLSNLGAANEAAIRSLNDVSSTSESAAARKVASLEATVVSDTDKSNTALESKITQIETLDSTSTSTSAQRIVDLTAMSDVFEGLVSEQVPAWSPATAYTAGDIVRVGLNESTAITANGDYDHSTYIRKYNLLENALEISHPADKNYFVGFYAVPMPSTAGHKIKFSFDIKGSVALGNGYDIRLYAYDGTTMNAGKAFISWFSSAETGQYYKDPATQQVTDYGGVQEDVALTTSYVSKSITANTYIGNGNDAKWISLVISPGSSATGVTYFVRNFKCEYLDASDVKTGEIDFTSRLIKAKTDHTGASPLDDTRWETIGKSNLTDFAATTTANIAAINNVAVDSGSAVSEALFTLKASVEHQTNGLAATRGLIDDVNSIDVSTGEHDGTGAAASSLRGVLQEVSVLNTEVGQPWSPSKSYVVGDIITTNYDNSAFADKNLGYELITGSKYDPVEDAFYFDPDDSDDGNTDASFYAFPTVFGYSYTFEFEAKTTVEGRDLRLAGPTPENYSLFHRVYYTTASTLGAGEYIVGTDSNLSYVHTVDDTQRIDGLGMHDITDVYQSRSFTYTPTATHKWASYMLLHRGDIGNHPVWFKNFRVTVKSGSTIVKTYTYKQRRFQCIANNTATTPDDTAYWADLGTGITGASAAIDDLNDISATSNSASARKTFALDASVTAAEGDIDNLQVDVGSDPDWDATPVYDPGQVVKYLLKGWRAKITNQNKQPDLNPTEWEDLGNYNLKELTSKSLGQIHDINDISATSNSAAARAIKSIETSFAGNTLSITELNKLDGTSTSANAQRLLSIDAVLKNDAPYWDHDNHLAQYTENTIVKADLSNIGFPHHALASDITFDPTEQALKLYSATDDKVAVALPYWNIPANAAKYHISLELKNGVTNTDATALYVRIYRKSGSLAAGKIYISQSGSTSINQLRNNYDRPDGNTDRRDLGQLANVNYPPHVTNSNFVSALEYTKVNKDWTTITFDYINGVDDDNASLNIYNWYGNDDVAGNELPLYVRNIRVTEHLTDGTISRSWTYDSGLYRAKADLIGRSIGDSTYWEHLGESYDNVSAAIRNLNEISLDSTSPLARSVNQVSTTVDGHTTTIEGTSAVTGLDAQYTVKVDANGHVAGFGLATTANNVGTVTSNFQFNANSFAITHPDYDLSGATTWYANTPYSIGDIVLYVYNNNSLPAPPQLSVGSEDTSIYYVCVEAHTSGSDAFVDVAAGKWQSCSVTPFVVTQAKAATATEDAVPGGVFIDAAHIRHASITNAQIGTVGADKITTGTLDASRIGANTLNVDHIDLDGTSLTAVDLDNGNKALKVGTLQSQEVRAEGILLASDSMLESDGNGGLKVSAITVSADNLTSGTLDTAQVSISGDAGISVRNGTGGNRMEINQSNIKVYAGGVLRVQLGNLS